jgi:predicted RNA binding protein YcfA (HicA-like mRNA interferase family)
MTQKQKLIEACIANPSSVKFKQLVIILEHFGFNMIQAKCSHVKFKHHQLSSDLIIPVHNGDCKDFYKREAYKLITEIHNF